MSATGWVAPDAVVTFPDGLPGFEASRQYVLVTSPELEPFMCLRGVDEGGPAFLAIDPRRVVADYPCALESPNAERIGRAAEAPLLWLAIVTASEHSASVNLRAPLVINPTSMLGVQVIAVESRYPFDQPLEPV